jgi:hypothetical protein
MCRLRNSPTRPPVFRRQCTAAADGGLRLVKWCKSWAPPENVSLDVRFGRRTGASRSGLTGLARSSSGSVSLRMDSRLKQRLPICHSSSISIRIEPTSLSTEPWSGNMPSTSVRRTIFLLSPFQRSLLKGLHHVVQRLADAAHPALLHPCQPESLQKLLHLARAHPLNIGALHHRKQRLLRPLPGCKQARKVAAVPRLGDAQLYLPHPRLPDPVPVAIAVAPAALAALVLGCPHQLACLCLH